MRDARLVLVRHAHMDDNHGGPTARLCGWCDAPLSALGRAQLEKLGARLLAEPPASAAYSSPLLRAKTTAEAACAGLGLSPWLDRDLREIYCGSVDGVPSGEVQKLYPDFWQRNLAQEDEQFRWPGGESYAEFRERALIAVKRIAVAHAGERVLIVTHAGVISEVLGWLAGLSAARWGEFRPGNASISGLNWRGDRGEVLRFDDRRHLEEAV